MTETPDWFQIPDSPEPEPKRPRRITLKVALITAPLLLIGGAVVFAQNGNEGDDQPNLPTLTATTNTQSTVSTSTTSASDNVNRANETIATTSKASVSKKMNSVKETVVTANSSKTTKSTAGVSAPNGLTGSGGVKNPGLPNGKDSDHGGLDRHKRPEGQENHQEGGEHQIFGGEDD